MSYIESIVAKARDATSAALDIHCVIEGVDELARTPSETVVGEVMWLAGQIANGGFDQYFFNSGVWSARRALDGLAQIGAEQTHQLLSEAIRLIGLPEDVPDDYQYNPPESVVKQLDGLDHRFYATDEQFYEKVVQFAIRNSHDFGFQNGV